MREVKEGRGSPHGGVFLDIAWIKERMPNAPEHIKRKLPSMYHQFKQLADIDITKEPMEVGPTTHYIMGGMRVDGDTQMSSVPGLVRRRRMRRRHQRRQPARRQLAVRSAGLRQARRRARREVRARTARGGDRPGAGRRAARAALEPFERGRTARSPYQVQHDAAGDDAGPGRDRPQGGRDAAGARRDCGSSRARAARVGVDGHREYNPGWHTALDLDNLLTVSEAIARSAIERKESRGGHFRDDYPDKTPEFGTFNFVVRQAADGSMEVSRVPIPEMPAELKQVIDENDVREESIRCSSATFRIWRGDAAGGRFHDYKTEVVRGMVVLDAVHQIQATQANDLAVRWNCKAGKCGSCSAEDQRQPQLMCMTRLNDLDARPSR